MPKLYTLCEVYLEKPQEWYDKMFNHVSITKCTVYATLPRDALFELFKYLFSREQAIIMDLICFIPQKYVNYRVYDKFRSVQRYQLAQRYKHAQTQPLNTSYINSNNMIDNKLNSVFQSLRFKYITALSLNFITVCNFQTDVNSFALYTNLERLEINYDGEFGNTDFLNKLPKNLASLTVTGSINFYNHRITGMRISADLKHLSLDTYDIDIGILPKTLKVIEFNSVVDSSFYLNVCAPDTLDLLVIKKKFYLRGTFPIYLKMLKINIINDNYTKYGLNILNALPNNLKVLDIYFDDFYHRVFKMPNTLEVLILEGCCDISFQSLPPNLRILSLSSFYDKQLPALPKSLEYIYLFMRRVRDVLDPDLLLSCNIKNIYVKPTFIDNDKWFETCSYHLGINRNDSKLSIKDFHIDDVYDNVRSILKIDGFEIYCKYKSESFRRYFS